MLTVFGAIAQRMSSLEESPGGCSCEDIGKYLDTAAAEPSVSLIVIVFDSPGGSVYGIDELGRKIASIRARKSIIGIADSIAASAAYWLLSQCSEVCVTGGGSVGSIGVLSAHEDLSEQQKKEGIKTSLISSGPHKTEGHPFGPLDADARAEIQSKCDHYYGMFVAAVARGRGVSEGKVKNSFGGGRMLTAPQAVAVGAADRIATLQQVLSDAAGGSAGGKGAKAEAAARAEARRVRSVQCCRESGAVVGSYTPGRASPSSSSRSGRTSVADALERCRQIERM